MGVVVVVVVVALAAVAELLIYHHRLMPPFFPLLSLPRPSLPSSHLNLRSTPLRLICHSFQFVPRHGKSCREGRRPFWTLPLFLGNNRFVGVLVKPTAIWKCVHTFGSKTLCPGAGWVERRATQFNTASFDSRQLSHNPTITALSHSARKPWGLNESLPKI